GTRCAPVNGYVAAYDKKGELVWHSDGPIQHQMVVLEQFKSLPILLFTVRYQEMNNRGGINLGQRWVASSYSINKFNGRPLCDTAVQPCTHQQQFHGLRIDLKGGTIALVGNNRVIQHYVDAGRKLPPLPVGGGIAPPAVPNGLGALVPPNGQPGVLLPPNAVQ